MGRNTMRKCFRAGFPLTAAALFLLAGTSGAVAQTTAPKAAPKSPAQPPQAAGQPAAPQAAAPAAPASGNPNATGKLIMQAGEKAGGEAQPADEGGDGKVKVDEHLIVDLHVNDEDLANVLQMLSIQSQKNIVSSKNVSAVVTANLYGVTFYEALDAILHVNGYGYIERGNFIYVYTLEELSKIEEQQRHQVWKVVKLNYLNATDAAEFVKPLLSEHGQIKTNGKPGAYTISDSAPNGDESFSHASTMMIFDYEENLAEIEKVVKELDTRPAQVLVEATILQTQLNEANAFGVDFSVIGDLDFTDFMNIGGPLKAVDGLLAGSGATSGTGTPPLPGPDGRGGSVVSNPGNTAGPATLKLGLVYNDVAAFLRVLDEVSDTTILSRPNILTLNRQSARVLVGRKVGYLNTTSTDTSTTQTVEFLDTGTQLYFRPFVSDGVIRMELKPKVSEAVIRNVTNSGGAAVTIPDEISNELTTNVMCKDGQTIVLGGLFRENTTASRKQVPGLGDLPFVGLAFRGHDDSVQRTEIIFMITPTVVSDAVLIDQADRGAASVDLVRTGSREALLPWSREKRTQQLVVQATEDMRNGKNDEALYKVQRALSMNRQMADALQLREALMSKKTSWPTRSLQHEIITNELGKKSGAKKASTTPTAPQFNARVEPTSVAVEQNGQFINQEPAQDANLTFTNTQVEPPTSPVNEPMAHPEDPTAPATFDPNVFEPTPATPPATPKAATTPAKPVAPAAKPAPTKPEASTAKPTAPAAKPVVPAAKPVVPAAKPAPVKPAAPKPVAPVAPAPKPVAPPTPADPFPVFDPNEPLDPNAYDPNMTFDPNQTFDPETPEPATEPAAEPTEPTTPEPKPEPAPAPTTPKGGQK